MIFAAGGAGFGRSTAQKAVWADRNIFNKAKSVLSDANMPKNIEEFNRICYNPRGSLLRELSLLSYEDAKRINELFNNRVIRSWYLAYDKQIPMMIDTSRSLENQAKQAFELRNTFRKNARSLMLNKEEADLLNKTDPILSFDDIVKHKKEKGLSGDDIYRDINSSSAKTRKSVNKKFGLE